MHPNSLPFTLAPWVVVHVPHASTLIPADIREQFVVDDETLDAELELLTDRYAEHLFGGFVVDAEPFGGSRGEVRPAVGLSAKFSRLVVDVERFFDDSREPAARVGFGAIYRRTTTGQPLRRELSERELHNLRLAYAMHHRHLTAQVEYMLERFGRCLILDCHTFPDQPLPFEQNPLGPRPDICIGTDPFHTPPALERAMVQEFRRAFPSTAVNRPFSGSLVPAKHYATDPRVYSVMVEVNRRICTGPAGEVGGVADPVAVLVRVLCKQAIREFAEDALGLPAAGIAPATAPPDESTESAESTESVESDESVETFYVSDYGTLSSSVCEEPSTRREVWDLGSGWEESAKDLVDSVCEGEPLAEVLCSSCRDDCDDLEYEAADLESDLEHAQDRMDEAVAEGGEAAEECDAYEAEIADLRQQLAAIREQIREREDADWYVTSSWLLGLDKEVYKREIVPIVDTWLDEGLDEWDYESGKVATGQDFALSYFQCMDRTQLELLGVVIIEGEHPGSSYYAAELRCSVDEANAAARAHGIPVRFVAE